MRIVFVCGSLEPGKDGVGDYTRLLAAELLNCGHQPALLAVNDRHISGEVEEGPHQDASAIPAVRFPAGMSRKERYRRATLWIAPFEPDLLSVQYVPYSYHVKGLPFHFKAFVKGLAKRYKLQIMFHELWLDRPENMGQRLIMCIQKYLIHTFITGCRPAIVNVSFPFNQRRLQAIGIKSSVLPLFGNIPERETVLFLPEFSAVADYPIRILYFGRAPGGVSKEQIMERLNAFCADRVNRVAVLVASGNSQATDHFVGELRDRLNRHGARIVDFGFLSTDEISFLMNSGTLGIARSAPRLLGKSGSAIAMLEHGLPVWLPEWEKGREQELEYEFRQNLIFADLEAAASCPDRPAYMPLLHDVALAFISQIKKNE